MARIVAEIALVIGAYLIGSFPYMLILSRAKGIDISRSEDFHMTTWRRVGRLAGASGAIVDMLKGVIPVLIGFVCDFSLAIIAIAGVAVVLGQMWPVFQRFNGEKGNTTGVGMAFAFSVGIGNAALWVLLSGALCFLAAVLFRTIPRFVAKGQSFAEKLNLGGPVSNSMPLGMLAGFIVMTLVSWFLEQPIEMTLALVVTLAAIIVRRLTANIGIDLKAPKTGVGKILLNRFLFDRSYFWECKSTPPSHHPQT
jgi:glycerol-3-phosphate acyltransferase PlsY